MKSLRILAMAALVLPAALAAQAAPAPQTNLITTALRTSGARNARLLMQAFDSIPEAKYDFKPTPAQLTFRQIATHLESANYTLCAVFGGTPRAMTARDSIADSVRSTWPKDSLTTRLKASFAFCDKAVANVVDANLADSVQAAPTRKVVRANYVLGYVTDLVDHYSQIANYMRLNGMLPPSALPRPGRGGN